MIVPHPLQHIGEFYCYECQTFAKWHVRQAHKSAHEFVKQLLAEKENSEQLIGLDSGFSFTESLA